jgi:hypothetical protein
VLNDILPSLDKVKQRGDRLWACCPVHQDKTPSLTLKEQDGMVLMHCFGCNANGLQVVEALGLPASVLFLKPLDRPAIPRKTIELAKEDRFFIAIYESEKEKGNKVTFNDSKRYRLATQRVKLLEQ